MRVGIVFPVYSTRKEHRESAIRCFKKLSFAVKKSTNKCLIFVVDDGGYDPKMSNFFRSENCIYDILDRDYKGVTRSWNVGAEKAQGNDVIVLGNHDAYPATADDLDNLAALTVKGRSTFFAVGPLTNAPGHIPQQNGSLESKQDGLQPVCYLNGFTWAVAQETYAGTVSARGFFLDQSSDQKFYLSPYGGIKKPWDGDILHSLAHLGQEDELFLWANRAYNKPCAIAHNSFWHHEKGNTKRDWGVSITS